MGVIAEFTLSVMEQSSSNGSAVVPVARYPTPHSKQTLDFVAVEEPLEIVVQLTGGERTSLGLTMRTPGDDVDLAIGLLYAEGAIKHGDEVMSVSEKPGRCRSRGSSEIKVVLDDTVSRLPSSMEVSVKTGACGLCGRTDTEHVLRSARAMPPSVSVISPELILRLQQEVRKCQRLFDRTGGLHAAALFDFSGHLLQLREDIGRHNAVDKIIGWAVRGNNPFDQTILFLSGRAGFELVHKAASAGIPIVVAVGAPSSIAVELAARSGLTLVGFAKDTTFNVYTGFERIGTDPGKAVGRGEMQTEFGYAE